MMQQVISSLRRVLQPRRAKRPAPRKLKWGQFLPSCEPLGERIMPAVTAIFSPAANVLSVFGDAQDNQITISRNAAGNILVNGGAVTIRGGTPTVANTVNIQVFGQNGDDVITLDEANGALPKATLFGDNGNDVLTGGSGADQLFGEKGNDTLLGKGGADLLFGGADNDTLTGGDADDQVFGQKGDDRMIWNPGDDTDLNEGGAGIDTVEVNGGNGTENFTTTANGARVRFDRIDPAPFSIDIGTSEKLVVNMNGGNDSFSASGNLAPLIQITVDGGAGDDFIVGSNGADRLLGGDGNDFIDGNQGNDVAIMGAGNDTFQWDPGDASDVVEGQDGFDTMVFNGSNLNENITLSANGERLRLTRDLGNVTMDTDDVERVDVNALGGTDTIVVNDLTGTDVTEINLNLAATDGEGDGAADTVVVNGTYGEDAAIVVGDATGVSVLGLAAQINITGSESLHDTLTFDLLAGDDVLNAQGLAANALKLTADGGADDDILIGSDGNDTLSGSDGDDIMIGGPGQDVLDGGTGENVIFQD